MNTGKAVGGVVLLAAGVGIFLWNEAATKRRAAGLASASKDCVTVSKVEAANEGKLVHVTGPVTGAKLTDKDFDVSAEGALTLTRKVETYQWKETSKSTGKGKDKKPTYAHEKVWSEKKIDSSKFKERQGHENLAPAFPSKTWKADKVKLGPFTLTPDRAAGLAPAKALPVPSLTWGLTFMDQTGKGEPNVAVTCVVCNKSLKRLGGLRDHQKAKHPKASVLALNTSQGLKLFPLGLWKDKTRTGLFVGNNPTAPQVGDLRISFLAAQAKEGTGVGQQKGDALVPYTTKSDSTIFALRAGKATQEQMFANLESGSAASGWLGRIVAIVIALIGLGVAGAGATAGSSGATEGATPQAAPEA